MISAVKPSYPIAVIGSGAGGLPAATVLAEAGFQVVLIERGGSVNADSFPTHRFDYELNTAPWSKESHEWKGPVDVQRGVGVGGSTLYFQAVSYLPSDNVLSSWGLPVAQIRRIESDITQFLQIAGQHQPPHPLNTVSTAIYNKTKKHGWKIRKAPVAILSQPHNNRPACNQCGLCIHGCRPGDKSSVDRTWLPRALRTGNVTLKTGTSVESIVLGQKDTVKALRLQFQGKSSLLPIKAVVVAAGALETPFLLKRSQQTLAPNGIGNDNVGRYLSASLWQSLLVSLPVANANGHAGIPVDLLVEEFAKEGILLCQGRNLAGITGPVSTARIHAAYLGNTAIREWVREYYFKLAGFGAYAESIGSRNDKIDINKKAYSKTLSTADHKKLKRMRHLLFDWADACNAEVLVELGGNDTPISGAMLRGSCRLGNRKDDSAVTVDGRLRGYKNVIISDASVLAPGVIAHPSLTLQVLGYYFGQQLSQRLKAA